MAINFVPATTEVSDLGTTDKYWNTIHTNTLNISNTNQYVSIVLKNIDISGNNPTIYLGKLDPTTYCTIHVNDFKDGKSNLCNINGESINLQHSGPTQ